MQREHFSEKGVFQKIRGKNHLFQIGMCICCVILIGSLLYIADYYKNQKEAEKKYQELREKQISVAEENFPEEEEPVAKAEDGSGEGQEPSLRRDRTIDFETLWEENEDIYAWIEIPETSVDYPIVQHPKDDGYYLNHTVERTEGLPGSIYSERIHPKDFSAANTILYGHNMKNDTMFGMLDDYKDEMFFEGHPYIYIYLPDRVLVYQIFAAAVFSDAYLPQYCDFESEEEFTSFFREIRERSVCFDGSGEVTYGDKVLTLSTCIGQEADKRFLIEAVPVEEYECQVH